MSLASTKSVAKFPFASPELRVARPTPPRGSLVRKRLNEDADAADARANAKARLEREIHEKHAIRDNQGSDNRPLLLGTAAREVGPRDR